MRKRLVKYLTDLVKIPSVIGSEKEIADFIHNFSMEFYPEEQTVRHNNSLMVFDFPDRDKKTVALVGHLDTVPGENQFTGQIIDGKLYGLGASDMKVWSCCYDGIDGVFFKSREEI
ncbi:MAG: M20/M25/M40 family metallo-hydrolase [Persephonella sp.]|nr:M20/M25/M40 family metallo-hydrolase [Persephonella sp.]